MFGFGKPKKDQEIPSKDLGIEMHTIPDIFYGGNDPVIYHTDDISDKKKKQTSVKKLNLKSRLPVVSSSLNKGVFRHKKIILGIGGGMILLVVTLGATWYYVRQAKQQVNTGITQTPEQQPSTLVTIQIEEPLDPSPSSTVVTTLDATTTATIAEIQAVDPVSFPRILLANSIDTDADQLTDEEESIFKTNPDVWDTDADGYNDGLEITNLYNPGGFAPVRLIDSGLVSEYVSPVWQYRVYYPQTWQVGTVDTEGRQVLMSTLSGDFVEVRVFDRIPSESFQNWFARTIEGEAFQDIQVFTNRFDVSVSLRKDGLVAYVLAPQQVMVLIYHPGITGAVPYRHVMRMMIESFRPTANTIDIPTQQVLPTPPLATSTVSSS